MAWSFEFRMGLVWAVIVTVLMVVALWLTRVAENVAPLLLPVLVFFVFVWWVDRIK
jgi:hypothetical protein